jgi:UDP-N-acetylglucosamine 4,6-dehydratase
MKIVDLAKALAPECQVKVIGIRPGEKIHEVMISSDDARNTYEYDDHYVIAPSFDWWKTSRPKGRRVAEDFYYSSDTNTNWVTRTQLKKMIKE